MLKIASTWLLLSTLNISTIYHQEQNIFNLCFSLCCLHYLSFTAIIISKTTCRPAVIYYFSAAFGRFIL